MAWIKTIPNDEADPALRQALEAQHALIPEALHHAFATFGALLSPSLPLTEGRPVWGCRVEQPAHPARGVFARRGRAPRP